jgi:DNA-binding NarL/FixJ family response regulator
VGNPYILQFSTVYVDFNQWGIRRPDRVGEDLMRRYRPQRVRILIADDHAPPTDRIKEIVGPNFEIVATVREGSEQALSQALALKPDVILINIAVVTPDCFETVKETILQLPRTRVIFHQNESGSCAAKVTLDGSSIIGRRSFARTSPAASAFSNAISVELKPNDHCVEASDALHPTNTPSWSDEPTGRECEVLALLAAGDSMKRIAHRLGITYRTVTFHKYRMMERLGITTNAGLINYALKRNVSEDLA